MKKMTVILLTATLAVFGFAGTSLALHDGGVAHCDACHTMHNSQDGAAETANAQFSGYSYLLKGSDQSSTCLNCHEGTPGSYHISTPGAMVQGTTVPTQLTPGGDFAWLKMDYTWNAWGTDYTEDGDSHGHNIIAADYGYAQDGTLTASPGGAYPADSFYCSSCHDPHGKYRVFEDGSVATTGLPIADRGSYPDGGNTHRSPSALGGWAVGAYRLLGGIGYEPKSAPGTAFTNTIPAAMAPSSYNRDESTTQTRTAYGSGMSEWCANCHGGILQDGFTSGMAGLKHPAGNNAELGATIAANYNSYVSSGILDPAQTDAYLSLTPFETGDGNDTVGRTAMAALAVNDDTALAGPEATDNVMCLTCHRAHASGFPDMLRFMETETFVTEEGAFALEMGRSDVDMQAAYYRDASGFGNFQRALCNKCHVKD